MPIWGIPKSYGFSRVLEHIVFRKFAIFFNTIVRLLPSGLKGSLSKRIGDRSFWGHCWLYVFLFGIFNDRRTHKPI